MINAKACVYLIVKNYLNMKKFKCGFWLLIFITSLVTTSCIIQKERHMTKNKIEDIPTGGEKFIVTAPIVLKSFTRKNAETTAYQEMYIQRSTQDYFIKFCESKVGLKELKNHLSKIDGDIKVVTLEVEFREGSWDICDDNELQQSRIGKYVIIHRIVGN